MASAARVCKHCGGTDVDVDQGRGDAVCMTCGSVLEDNIIVSEVQFEQNAGGGSSVIGQYVSAEAGGKTPNLGGSFHHGIGRESRQITLQNGQKRIKMVGAQLKLNSHCVETAYNFYKMAVARRLTRGRRSAHVVAACLYIVCRTEGTGHMLLDFSDVLQVDVYTLGRTYLALARDLHINIPALDPCLYIQRFAHKLEFDDKTHDVSMTALRLVQRMKRDWMAQGRRPSGLCGAALLVAARIHNFNRSIREIIKVVKIGEQTIRKRLHEFESTASGQLTIDEFNKIDLEEEADPPCFTEGKKKAKFKQEIEEQLPELTEEMEGLREEIDNAIEEHLVKKHRRFGKNNISTSSDSESSSSQGGPTVTEVSRIEAANVNKEVDDFLQSELVKDMLEDTEIDSIRLNLKLPPVETNSKKQGEENGEVAENGVDVEVERLEKAELDSLLMPPPSGVAAMQSGGLKARPSLASLGIRDSIEECMKVEPAREEPMAPPTVSESEDLDLTGIDDDEIEGYILSDDAAKKKTIFWLKANALYLREQKEKEQKRLQEEEEERNKPDHLKKKKRTVNRKKRVKTESHTAGEAIEKMLHEKRISSKINYDVLKGLNNTPSTPVHIDAPASPFSPAPILPIGDVIDETTPSSFTSIRPKRTIKEEPKTLHKKPKIEPKVKEETKVKELKQDEPTPAEVIVESGPVAYAAEEDDEEDYFEDEDEPVSAAQLMGHGGIDDYGDEDEYYDE